jgi:hypothetical protein
MKANAGIAVILVVLLAGVPSSALPAEKEPLADAVKSDLAKLQGKWEMIASAGDRMIRSVQTIDGTISTVDRFDKKGELIQSHTAQFRLQVTDRVRILAFFDLEVTTGPNKGLKFKGPLSYIYAIHRDSFVEARGFLVDQEDGDPRLIIWRRAVDKVAAKGQSPLGPALLDKIH